MGQDATKEHRFTMVMEKEVRRKLEALAEADRRSAADWIRLAIIDAFEARFGGSDAKRKK